VVVIDKNAFFAPLLAVLLSLAQTQWEEGIVSLILQWVLCYFIFSFGISYGERRCKRCLLSRYGPKVRLTVSFDLAFFKDVREDFQKYQRAVLTDVLEEDGLFDEKTLEFMKCDPSIVLYTAYICGCATQSDIDKFINELLIAARDAVARLGDADCQLEPGHLRFSALERVGKTIGFVADEGSILEDIHHQMRTVGADFLAQGPSGQFIPCIGLFILQWEDYRKATTKIMRFAWDHDVPDFCAPYSSFMQRKDGVWHLQDVFKVKTEQLDPGEFDELWNFFHC